MSNETAIAWTDFSSNPIKYRDRETGKTVWACVKKSAGCTHCYSEALALRWNKGRAFARPNIDKVVPFLDDKEMQRLATDPKLAGRKVFIGDMTDIFGSWVPDDFLDHLFAVFAWRQDVTFHCLTKRPQRMSEYLSALTCDGGYRPYIRRPGWKAKDPRDGDKVLLLGEDQTWPLLNVWLGTSVEDQRAADERIPHLLNTPAAVRFLSCEPLLGPVRLWDFNEWEGRLEGPGIVHDYRMGPNTVNGPGEVEGASYPGLDWVIVGGESGPGHRQMELAWLTSIAEQCQEAGVPVFIKQDSGIYPGRQGRIPDSLWQLKEFPDVAVR